MNAQKRKELQEAIDYLEKARVIIEEIRDEEQNCFDNLPEGLQCSEKGDKFQEAIDNLDTVASDLDQSIMTVEETIQN